MDEKLQADASKQLNDIERIRWVLQWQHEVHVEFLIDGVSDAVFEIKKNSIWNTEQKSFFIESVLIGFPIMPIFTRYVGNSKFEVIDGNQRINTINEFYNDKFKLSGLQILTTFNDFTFSDLPKGIQKTFLNQRLLHYYFHHDNDEFDQNVLSRLNGNTNKSTE